MKQSLSCDVILYNLLDFINDEETFGKLLMLNKYMYKRSTQPLYRGKIIVEDVKLLKFITVKKQFANICVYVWESFDQKKINLKSCVNLKKLTMKNINSINFESTSMRVIFPKSITEIRFDKVDIYPHMIPEKITHLTIKSMNEPIKKELFENCRSSLKQLKLIMTMDVRSIEINTFNNLKRIIFNTVDIGEISILPDKIEELYLVDTFYGPEHNKISLKKYKYLKAFVFIPFDDDKEYKVTDLSDSLEIILIKDNVTLNKEPKNKSLILYNRYIPPEIKPPLILANNYFKITVPIRGIRYQEKIGRICAEKHYKYFKSCGNCGLLYRRDIDRFNEYSKIAKYLRYLNYIDVLILKRAVGIKI